MHRRSHLSLVVIGTAVLSITLNVSAQEAARASGIYVLPASGTGEPTRIEATMMTQGRADGAMKSVFTGGFSKPTMVLTLPGAHADEQLTGAPTFEFVFASGKTKPRSGMSAEDMAAMMEAMNGLPFNHPKQYVLAVLAVQGEDRELRAGKSPTIECDIEVVSAKVFRVKPRSALPAGEYGFYAKDAPGRVWDFGITGAAGTSR